MLSDALEWSKEESDIVLRALALRRRRIFPPLFAEAGRFYLGSDNPKQKRKKPVKFKSIERMVIAIEAKYHGVGRWLD